MTKERKQTLFALLAAVGIVACVVGLVFVSLKTHKYQLTFISEGATVAEEEITTGTCYSSKFKPVKQDYVFVGWTLDTEENEIYDFSANPIESSNRFYAVFEPLVAAEKLSYDRETQEIELGGKATLVVLAEPIGFNADILYSSNDTAIATVDENGVVTGVALGTTTIEAKSGDVTTLITVEVKAVPHSLTVEEKVEVDVCEMVALHPSIDPEDAAHNYVFESSNEDIALVDAFGNVTGVNAGTVIITVSVGSTKATCFVTVIKPNPEEIVVDVASVVLNLASEEQSVKQLITSILPTGADQTVTYETSNPVVVTVDENGLLTGKSVGEAVVSIKTSNGLEKKINVKVSRTASAISKTQSSYAVWVGASYTLENYLSFDPITAKASYSVTWSVVSGKEYISVDANSGKITGLKPSTSTVRVRATAVSVSDTQTIDFDIWVNGGELTLDKPQGNYLYFVTGGNGNSIDLTGRVIWKLYEWGKVTETKLDCTDYTIKTSSNLKMKTGNLMVLASNASSATDTVVTVSKTYQNHTYTTSEWTIHLEPELCIKKVDGRSTAAKPTEVTASFEEGTVEITLSMQASLIGTGVSVEHEDPESNIYVLTLSGDNGTVEVTTPAGQTMTLTVTRAAEE